MRIKNLSNLFKALGICAVCLVVIYPIGVPAIECEKEIIGKIVQIQKDEGWQPNVVPLSCTKNDDVSQCNQSGNQESCPSGKTRNFKFVVPNSNNGCYQVEYTSSCNKVIVTQAIGQKQK